LAVGAENSQVSDLVSVVEQPGCACLFQTGLKHMAMSAFDHASEESSATFQVALQAAAGFTVKLKINPAW
jgi:hypothetical protein